MRGTRLVRRLKKRKNSVRTIPKAVEICLYVLGMHKDLPDGLTDFEREMRRRVWCLLYVWDWYDRLAAEISAH